MIKRKKTRNNKGTPTKPNSDSTDSFGIDTTKKNISNSPPNNETSPKQLAKKPEEDSKNSPPFDEASGEDKSKNDTPNISNDKMLVLALGISEGDEFEAAWGKKPNETCQNYISRLIQKPDKNEAESSIDYYRRSSRILELKRDKLIDKLESFEIVNPTAETPKQLSNSEKESFTNLENSLRDQYLKEKDEIILELAQDYIKKHPKGNKKIQKITESHLQKKANLQKQLDDLIHQKDELLNQRKEIEKGIEQTQITLENLTKQLETPKAEIQTEFSTHETYHNDHLERIKTIWSILQLIKVEHDALKALKFSPKLGITKKELSSRSTYWGKYFSKSSKTSKD